MVVRLGARPAAVDDIAAIAQGEPVELDDVALATLSASRAVVERAIAAGEPVYGLNRRLGAGRDDAVDPAEFAAYQRLTLIHI